jgi:hypothetical protein
MVSAAAENALTWDERSGRLHENAHVLLTLSDEIRVEKKTVNNSPQSVFSLERSIS